RWHLLHRLSVLGGADAADIDAETRADPSARGAELAESCRAALPDAEAKERAWRRITAEPEVSAQLASAAASGFWQPGQEEFTDAYVPRYFDEIAAATRDRGQFAVMRIGASAFPRLAVAPETLERARDLACRDDVDDILRRAIVDAADGVRVALEVRAMG
ncbi:MAG TPA: ERAP1-like C-terminal domain-containing protein, partial [Stackebrandtia sp.]|uniref:ERAP1-like C-terminal domain-containing protein n=1 Tax=Stackebrandtia sp. TaxID=2023065 RepID=UPI002D59178B